MLANKVCVMINKLLLLQSLFIVVFTSHYSFVLAEIYSSKAARKRRKSGSHPEH